jgi:hypothetical protein
VPWREKQQEVGGESQLHVSFCHIVSIPAARLRNGTRAILRYVDISAKLQIKPGQRVATLAGFEDVPSVVPSEQTGPADAADVIVAFVRARAELDTVAGPAIEAALRDNLAWIAYPKAGQLGTDLNRDILAGALAQRGVQPVRQVAIDEVWSALRFRPA